MPSEADKQALEVLKRFAPPPVSPTNAERLALLASDLHDARYHVLFLDGEWNDVARLHAAIIDAQAALRKLMR